MNIIAPVLVITGLMLLAGCNKTPPAPPAPPLTAAPSKTLTSAVELSAPATVLNAASLSTAVTQGTLDQVRDRIDFLTESADHIVTMIERETPTQAVLIRLNAVFSDTKRSLMTDTQLAALGLQLDGPAREAVAEYTKRSHKALMSRLRIAGRKRRVNRAP